MKIQGIFFKILIPVTIGFLALTAGGCSQKEAEEVPELLEPATGSEKYVVAEYRTIYEFKCFNGQVIPELKELAFSDSGKLDKILVSIGEEVTEGQELATLKSSSDAYDALTEQLREMREENEYNDRQRAIEMEIAELAEQDAARLKLVDSQKKELQALEEKYLLGRIAAEKEKLSGSVITAPFDGVVVAINDTRSDTFIDEDTPVMVIAGKGECYVYCDYITEKAARLYDSTTALIDGTEYDITYVPYGDGEIIKLMENNEDYYSIFRVEGGSAELTGKQATVELKKNMRENVLTVPASAVSTEGGSSYVYRVSGTQKILTQVKTGVIGNMYAEITEGLSEGDMVYVPD
ncbi:MAG: efflux RND transporter periplasmic adaptor subunit [Lachnospiraceae bacterium]|nr:efflux RND transporter periplasmic adaptor subunit [Lachnospiraceae bacterium]